MELEHLDPVVASSGVAFSRRRREPHPWEEPNVDGHYRRIERRSVVFWICSSFAAEVDPTSPRTVFACASSLRTLASLRCSIT
jgi:hypothetical protein